MTEQDILLAQVEVRILKYLLRMKVSYRQALYQIVGRGVTPQEFFTICDKLVEKGALKTFSGKRDAELLQWVEQPTEVTCGTVNA
jgi:hypothetical protein